MRFWLSIPMYIIHKQTLIITHKHMWILCQSTLAFFLMCLRRGWAGCGPGWDSAPNEYFLKEGRWNCRSFIGPIWVGKKGCLNSTEGMECWGKKCWKKISGGPLSALTCCVNARLLSAIKKISPLIYSQSWVGSWVYTMQAMMTFTLIF